MDPIYNRSIHQSASDSNLDLDPTMKESFHNWVVGFADSLVNDFDIKDS